MKADCAFTFCLKNIDRGTDFGEELYQSLLKRILERRTKLSSILQQLHDRGTGDVDPNFPKATKKQVIDFVQQLVEKVQKGIKEREAKKRMEKLI